MLSQIIQKIKTAPKEPGVYIFYKEKNSLPAGRQALYVGKASNLRNRLKNYLTITDIKTEALHREADNIKVIILRSNIEALIVESELIKELKPQYNVLWQDDKSYFYVYFTKEQFPKIIIGHKTPRGIKNKESGITRNSLFIIPNSQQIGPFTDGNSLKVILRLLRRFFPYCTCKPHLRICLNSQINNCPGYCCNKNAVSTKSEISAYKKNILKIKNILTGKDKKFIHTLKDPYELLVLEKIWQHQPYLENSEMQKVKSDMSHSPFNFSSAECYDNSHLSGKEAVGAMTAWKKDGGIWSADKNMWRKFRIRGNYTEDDPRMMEEVVSRRLNHPEWPYPDLIIIDGGITQFRAAKRAVSRIMNDELGIMNKNKSIIHNSQFIIPKVISFAKPEQQIYGIETLPISIKKLPEHMQRLIAMAIQNTHNFVVRYHRKVRAQKFLPPDNRIDSHQ